VIKFWLVHISIHTLACSSWQVILATNVAESSVTIPGVSFVIDSCRSVEIYWDTVKQLHCSRLVWISQSQVIFLVV
jgi:HrpA-like RNA helicase